MMPAFSPAISVDGVAEEPLVVDRDRRDDSDLRVRDVGAVPGAADADLDDRRVDGCVGEGGKGHARQDFEERQWHLAARVDEVEVRRDLVVRRQEARLVDGTAVKADAFAHGVQVRAGEPAGAQTELTQQRVDHAGGRRLAVRARHLDHRRRGLGRAEQVEQHADAVETGVDLVLGCAADDGPLDLGHPFGHRQVCHVIESRCRSFAGISVPGWGDRPHTSRPADPGRKDIREE